MYLADRSCTRDSGRSWVEGRQATLQPSGRLALIHVLEWLSQDELFVGARIHFLVVPCRLESHRCG